MSKQKSFLIVQNAPILGKVKANTEKVYSLVKNASIKKPDFIVLPELWNIGWCPRIFQSNAEPIENSATIKFLQELAKELNTNIFGGSFISVQSGKFYNTCPIIDRTGKLVAIYNKIHLFSYDDFCEDKYLDYGKSGVIINLEGIKFGLSICYDLRFPELFKAMSTQGAEVFINMAAWPKSRKNHWYALQKARAIENQAFVIACSQTGRIEAELCNLGHSFIVDPLGEIIEKLDDEAKCLSGIINIEEVDDIRKVRSIMKDIRPQCYGIRIN